jgi:hypothetical protein
MEEAPENGKESSHSAHANGMNEWMNECLNDICYTEMKNLIQFTINVSKSHCLPQCSLQLVCEDRAFSVGVDLHVSARRQQHQKCERAVRLVYSPYVNFACHPVPETENVRVSALEIQTALSRSTSTIRHLLILTLFSHNGRYYHLPKYWHFLPNHPVCYVPEKCFRVTKLFGRGSCVIERMVTRLGLQPEIFVFCTVFRQVLGSVWPSVPLGNGDCVPGLKGTVGRMTEVCGNV